MTVAMLGADVHATALATPDGTSLLTYGQLDLHAERLADRLRPHVGPGSVLACVLPNGPAFAVALLAAARLSACFAPLGHRLTSPERTRLFDVLRPLVLVAGPGVEPPASCAVLARWTDPWAPWPDEVHARRPLVAPEDDGELAPRHGDALILLTSGSTGTPKGVLLTRENVAAGTGAVVARYGLTPADRTVALLPWTHGHGLIGVLLSTLRAGGSIVVAREQRLDHALRAPATTWLSLVPPLLHELCAATGSPRLRFIRTASAPLPAELASAAEARFDCPVAEAYGMTETAHQAAANAPAFDARRLGWVGHPSGTQFRRGPVRVGEGHELEVSGPAVFRGYLRDPRATAAALAGGWYRTGDIGRIGPDGAIRLLGRLTEHINRGGSKVSPVEVEEALAGHPDITACLVLGVPHPVLGEEIAALVQARPGASLTAEAVHAHCGTRLAPYKVPRVIRFVAALPRLPNGKPSRRLAAGLLAAGPG
ncbi:MAG TPA: AMP-binding protein, partial [Candidatus Dormibacteraeota bacterium]|nr:AMP-binding protein [Candidatus Dormibacteraeota bacterium]